MPHGSQTTEMHKHVHKNTASVRPKSLNMLMCEAINLSTANRRRTVFTSVIYLLWNANMLEESSLQRSE